MLRRRAMMAQATDTDSPINPLINGNYKGTNGSVGDIKVTLGCHVYGYKRYGDSSWGYNVPFTNTFDLAVGDVVELKAHLITKTTGNVSVHLRSSSANVLTMGTLSTVGETYTFNQTVTTAATVQYIRANCSGSAKSNHTVEYEMYVNGVRFI